MPKIFFPQVLLAVCHSFTAEDEEKLRKVKFSVFFLRCIENDGGNVTDAQRTVKLMLNYNGAKEPYKTATLLGDDTQLNTPLAPEREGYRFDGWYKDAACSSKAVFPFDVEDGNVFYAKWTEIKEEIQKPEAPTLPTTTPEKVTESADTTPVEMWFILTVISGAIFTVLAIKKQTRKG